ncbi:DUF2625 family protein [Aggregicoccus sp. 17bor-14]|uniref:DUF2625 family protein n=1 Tax=Myxococcaceae TaxID=31 RepID=UPI0012F2C985|nr:DUF2625 family protein [Simulacricoccus sp. 17bor-14]MRI88154.1 DUF2625 family protein [Aggregicoccus sp. 17bor-14]
MSGLVDQLVDKADPALPLLQSWVKAAAHPVELLPPTRSQAEVVLLSLGVSTRSVLGTVAYETGGLLVGGGWLRVLGAGHERLPRDLAGWNGIDASPPEPRLPGALLVADDAVGGFFAVNGGRFKGPHGHVHYLAPDTLAWESLERGYSEFVHWALTGDVDGFYENARWEGWDADLRGLSGEQGFSVYPPLWAPLPDGSVRSRKPASIEELWKAHSAPPKGNG